MKPTLLILAAGMGSRYGGLKQVDPVGPHGETIMDYAIFDALRSGFGSIVFVIRRDFESVFRKTIGAKYAGQVEVDYAFQELDDLPVNFALPAGRSKPWGTAHAVRAARSLVTTPFAAINADDFYGHDAFARLGVFLSQVDWRAKPTPFAMVGFKLERTLSEHGSVARGICRIDGDNRLVSITEMTKLVRVPGGVENRERPETPVTLTGREFASMNLWGFTPALFELLEERFPKWLDMQTPDTENEWYIPFAVDSMIRDGAAEVSVLPTDGSWFGVTYREDKPVVEEAIRNLIAAGAYPERLW